MIAAGDNVTAATVAVFRKKHPGGIQKSIKETFKNCDKDSMKSF